MQEMQALPESKSNKPKVWKTHACNTLCVDLVGPCKIQRKGKDDLKPWCLTMIDPVTGWFEMEQIENKTAAKIADTCETTWFTRCPLPQRIILDRGTEFMAEFASQKRLRPKTETNHH